MARLAAVPLFFGLLRAAAQADDKSCLLQTKVTPAQPVAQGAEAPKCPLPANGQWCKVQVGQANFNMAVYNSGDIVSQEICQSGTWELQPNDITALGQPGRAIDIGANVGFYSFVLAAHGWNVTAFEPMVTNHELMDATMCANPSLKEKITLNRFALGAKDDHCIIKSRDYNQGDGLTQCGEDAKKPIQPPYQLRGTMDVRRLDDVLIEQGVSKVDFVKMDVEGFECQVMAGGQSLLTTIRPKLIQSEVWHTMQGCKPEDYLSSFAKASYSVTKDRACTQPGLERPAQIENRYMCLEKPQIGLSLMEIAARVNADERRIVWLRADEHAHTN